MPRKSLNNKLNQEKSTMTQAEFLKKWRDGIQPMSELEPDLAAVVQAERERCAKIICIGCHKDWPFDGKYHSIPPPDQRCGTTLVCLASKFRAAAIRRGGA